MSAEKGIAHGKMKDEATSTSGNDTNGHATVPRRRGRSPDGSHKNRIHRHRSSSLSDINRLRGSRGVGGLEADENQLPSMGAFSSIRAKYLDAMKGSNEKGIFSRAELAIVGQIEDETINTAAKPRRKTVQRTRSRSLTMIDSERSTRKGDRNRDNLKNNNLPAGKASSAIQFKQEAPRRAGKRPSKQGNPPVDQEPTRGRGKTVARSRSRSLTSLGVNKHNNKINNSISKVKEQKASDAVASGSSRQVHGPVVRTKPQRARSRSLTTFKAESFSTRNLICMFDRGTNNDLVRAAKGNKEASRRIGKRPSLVQQDKNEKQQEPQLQAKQPTGRGRERGRTVARSRSRSLTSLGVNATSKNDNNSNSNKTSEEKEDVVTNGTSFQKPVPVKGRPQRMRSRSLTAFRNESTSTRNLISKFNKETQNDLLLLVTKEQPRRAGKRPSKQHQEQQPGELALVGRGRGRPLARSRSRSLTSPGVESSEAMSNTNRNQGNRNSSGVVDAKWSYHQKPAPVKARPQRMRSKSLTAFKGESGSTRKLISEFSKETNSDLLQTVEINKEQPRRVGKRPQKQDHQQSKLKQPASRIWKLEKEPMESPSTRDTDHTKLAPTKGRPQRTRSRSLTSFKAGSVSTRNLIGMFDKGADDNEMVKKSTQFRRKPQRARSRSLTTPIKRDTVYKTTGIAKPRGSALTVGSVVADRNDKNAAREERPKPVVVKLSAGVSKLIHTKRKPQRARSRSLTSIKRERGADGVTTSVLDYDPTDKWVSLKSRSATKLQAVVRGYLRRLQWILKKPTLKKLKIQKEKQLELQRIQQEKKDAMLDFQVELLREDKARKKQVKALLKEKTSLEKQFAAAQNTRDNWRWEMRKEREQARRWAEAKKVDNVVTMLNSSAVTGFQGQLLGSQKRIKVYKKEIDAVNRELDEVERNHDYERNLSREVDKCIRSIIETLREGLGDDDEFVEYVVKYSGVDV